MSTTGARSALAGLWDKVLFWRALAGGLGVVALALLVAALIGRAPPDFSARPVIAVLRDAAGHALWAIRLGRGADQIAADSLAVPPVAAGRVYQLWLEAPRAAGPHSLGLLPRAGRKTIAETPADIRLLGGPGELIVTLEALGGSPRSRPSGPVRSRGALAAPG